MPKYIQCPLGCGFNHAENDTSPRHNSVWLSADRDRLLTEIALLKENNSQLFRAKDDLSQALETLRQVNLDLHNEVQRLRKAKSGWRAFIGF